MSSTSDGAWVTTRRDTLPKSCSEAESPVLPITISSVSVWEAVIKIASAGASAESATSWSAPSRSAIFSARSTASPARSGFAYAWAMVSLAPRAAASVAATCSAVSADAEPSVATTMRR